MAKFLIFGIPKSLKIFQIHLVWSFSLLNIRFCYFVKKELVKIGDIEVGDFIAFGPMEDVRPSI